jgi:glycosyltransferase involved in cell wall biosynthesis
MTKLLRVTTRPISLDLLLEGQMRFMKEKGVDVLMCSSDGIEVKKVLEKEQCPHQVVALQKNISIVKDTKALFQMIRLIKRFKPDIVHSHTPKAGLIAMLAAFLCGVKVRLHTNSGTPLITATGFKRIIIKKFEKLSYVCATHVYANSHSLKNFILAEKMISPNKISIIGYGSSNGIDLNRYNAAAILPSKLEKIKTDINFSNNLFYFLFVGRIANDKGINELIKAFAELCKINKNIRLIVLGSYENEFDGVGLATKDILENNKNIINFGWCDDVEYFMHFSNALVHPTYREGFPNVLLQAGAMSCPILCSKVTGNVDVVTSEEIGTTFSAKSEDDLLKKMAYALVNEEEIKGKASKMLIEIQNKYKRELMHNLIYAEYLKQQ